MSARACVDLAGAAIASGANFADHVWDAVDRKARAWRTHESGRFSRAQQVLNV